MSLGTSRQSIHLISVASSPKKTVKEGLSTDHGERYLKYPRQRTVSIKSRQTMLFTHQIGIICVSWMSGEQRCWIIEYLVKVFPPCYSYLTLANEITKKHPKYHGYSNNCQNFVQHLLRYVCPQSTVPSTIKEITNLWRGILRDRTIWLCLRLFLAVLWLGKGLASVLEDVCEKMNVRPGFQLY